MAVLTIQELAEEAQHYSGVDNFLQIKTAQTSAGITIGYGPFLHAIEDYVIDAEDTRFDDRVDFYSGWNDHDRYVVNGVELFSSFDCYSF